MSLSDAIFNACGQHLTKMQRITGGNICEAYCATLEHGEKLFIKVHDNSEMLHAEALGLDWISTAGAETPTVFAHTLSSDKNGFLALSWIDAVRPSLSDWSDFGEQLAQLHNRDEKSNGWFQNNKLGFLHQDNRRTSRWIDFFRDRRLMPQVKLAIDNKRASINLSRKMDPLLRNLEERITEPSFISPLHGDLWHGNVLFKKRGGACFIDPAPYCGHREMDFAMMELFGGFHPRAIATYEDVLPLDDQWRERVPVYQLYYLLAHVNLHGASWMGQVYATLDQLN